MASDFDPKESIHRVGSQPQETKLWKYRKVALALRSCSNCGVGAPWRGALICRNVESLWGRSPMLKACFRVNRAVYPPLLTAVGCNAFP